MSTTTPVPPRLLNTTTPDPEHCDELQLSLDELVQDTGASYGVVFGTHGLHLLRSGELDQVGAEGVTAVMTNVLLLSRGMGRLTERGEAETIVVRYHSGALVLAPLSHAFGLGLFSDHIGDLKQIAYGITRFCSRTTHLLPQDLVSAPAVAQPLTEGAR